MQNILLVLTSYLVSVEENVHFFVTARHKLVSPVFPHRMLLVQHLSIRPLMDIVTMLRR